MLRIMPQKHSMREVPHLIQYLPRPQSTLAAPIKSILVVADENKAKRVEFIDAGLYVVSETATNTNSTHNSSVAIVSDEA